MKVIWGLLLLLVGCGSPGAAAPILDQVGYTEEVRNTYSVMKWPSDVKPDLDALIKATSPPAGVHVQQGVSRQVLAVVNTCAWYRSWDLAVQRGDSAAVASSLHVITDVVTKYPPEVDKAGREYVEEAARQASAGNGHLVRNYVEANCDETVWAS